MLPSAAIFFISLFLMVGSNANGDAKLGGWDSSGNRPGGGSSDGYWGRGGGRSEPGGSGTTGFVNGTATVSQPIGTNNGGSGGDGLNSSDSTKRSFGPSDECGFDVSNVNTQFMSGTTTWASQQNLNGTTPGSLNAVNMADPNGGCLLIAAIFVDAVSVKAFAGSGDCHFLGSKATYTVHTEGVAPGIWAPPVQVQPSDRILFQVGCDHN